MKYFLWTNITTLRRNLATYVPTFLFMAVGMAILYVMMCGIFSYTDDLDRRLKNAGEQDIIIINERSADQLRPSREETMSFLHSPRRKNTYIVDEDAVLTPADLQLIRERFGDKVDFKAAVTTANRTNSGNYVLFVSDGYMEPFLRQRQGDFIVTSKLMLELLISEVSADLNNTVSSQFRQFPLNYDPERQVFTDLDGQGEIEVLLFEDADYLNDFEWEYLSLFYGSDISSAFSQSGEPNWDNLLLVPMKYYFDVYYPGDNRKFQMTAGADNFEYLYDLLNLLNENHQGRVLYGIDETTDLLLRQVSQQAELAAAVIPITLVVLLIVGMNFTGLQLLSVKRRRRNLAIGAACGARRRFLLSGVPFLTLLTVTCAALIAVTIGMILVHKLGIQLYNVEVTLKWQAGAFVFGFAWLIGLLSGIPPLVQLSKMSPVEILTEQQVQP